jgi:hypothetical protein
VCVSRVLRADHDVVRPRGAQPVSSPSPAVRYPGQALDARAKQDRAEQLGLGLATGDLDYDPVVHLGYPNVRAKFTSTTRLRSSAGPSGSESSHSVAPSRDGICTRWKTLN